MKKTRLLIIFMTAVMITLLPISTYSVHAEQKFGGGGSGGGSSGGGSSDSGTPSYNPPSGGESSGSSGSSNSQVDEAAAAWFNEQARIKAEQEAALNALLLQQQAAAAKSVKRSSKKAEKEPKPVTDSAMSDEINAMKENAASLANTKFAENTDEGDITAKETDTAVVTDLTNAESEDENTLTAPVAYAEETIAVNTESSTDAAISKYIEDSLIADTSEVSTRTGTADIIATTDEGTIIPKTAKRALIAVLIVVLVIITIVGVVIIMLRMGYLNAVSLDDYDEGYSDMPIMADTRE